MIAAVALGCRPPQPQTNDDRPPTPAEDAARPGFLTPPFTAEQIRGEWVEGLELTIRRWAADAEALESWRVVQADADGVDIESTVRDGDGNVIRPTAVRHSTWTELRDHASFPADRATRERVTRDTALGDLDGWLYTVSDPDSGTISEFFFAVSLPGAPVYVHVFRDGELVEIFEQVDRRRPTPG